MGWIESNLGHLEQRVEYLFRMFDRFEQRLRSVEQGLQRAFQQDQGTSGGGGSGLFYADHLNIAANSTATGVTVVRSWTGANDTTNGTVRNTGPDATTNTRRQYLIKNPDNTYSLVGQSCTNS